MSYHKSPSCVYKPLLLSSISFLTHSSACIKNFFEQRLWAPLKILEQARNVCETALLFELGKKRHMVDTVF
jgi:hypothetical protein